MVVARESQLISIDLMIARGGRMGGAAHGDAAPTYAAFNPSRRPDVGTCSRHSHVSYSS